MRQPRARSSSAFVLLAPLLALAAGCHGREPCPEAYFDEEIFVPATDTTIVVNGRVTAHTTDPQSAIQVSIDDNQGTVAFAGRGPMQAFVYRRVIDVAPDEMLFQGLGIADGAWYPFWMYCSRDGRLTYFYGERTDSFQVVSTGVSGGCKNLDDTLTMSLQIPAHGVRHVAMTCECTARSPGPTDAATETPSLQILPSQPGTVINADHAATLLAFTTADCRGGSTWACGSNRRWLEIHALIWDESLASLSFAVFYVYVDGTVEGVNALTGLALPAGTWSNLLFPDAEWKLTR